MTIPYPFIDPVLLTLPGGIDVRWYGIAYVAAFVVADRVLRRLARAGRFPAEPNELWDLGTWLVVAVLVGGRLGEALFFSHELLRSPLALLKFWEGGRSFHGGLLGVAVVILLFARIKRRASLAVGDGVTLAVLPGLFFGRIANFINGELYGRVAGPQAFFGTRFPTEPVALDLLGLDDLPRRAQEEGILRAFSSGQWDAIAEQVPLRHPTQLYEALGESVLIALVFYLLHRHLRGRLIGDGFFFGLFLAMYGVARILIESFRDRDSTAIASVSSGQMLSALMVLAGIVLVRRAIRHPEEAKVRGSAFYAGAPKSAGLD